MQHDFILLDRSGSMGGPMWPEALGAINGYVETLAKDNVDTGVTLATFDTHGPGIAFDIIRDRITPPTWKKVTNEDAEPRGSTPLNDAIGKIVTLAKAGINGQQYDKVAIIIMTDGFENASREYTHEKAKTLLEECRAKGWQVIFLGANFDNAAQATSYGTVSGQHVNSTMRNMRATMSATADKRFLYGTGAAATMSFSDDEKKKAAEQ